MPSLCSQVKIDASKLFIRERHIPKKTEESGKSIFQPPANKVR